MVNLEHCLQSRMVCPAISVGSQGLINDNIPAPSTLSLLGGACGGGQALLGTWVLQAKLALSPSLKFCAYISTAYFLLSLLLTLSKLSNSEAFVTPGVAFTGHDQGRERPECGSLKTPETGTVRQRNLKGELGGGRGGWWKKNCD